MEYEKKGGYKKQGYYNNTGRSSSGIDLFEMFLLYVTL